MPDAPDAFDLTIRPAAGDELDVVARIRARCYRPNYAREHDMRDATRTDRADVDAGDMLLTELDGRVVATTTCLRGEMNVRGSVLPCNGIAWVGTSHDARRSGGVASKTMHHALGLARERGEVLSALMPFRASYYEHFGYGLCERRALWTIPVPILPQAPRGEPPTHRFVEPDDDAMLQTLADLRRGQFESAALGHGDVAFPHAAMGGMRHWFDWYTKNGYLFADVGDDGQTRGWIGVHPVDKPDGRVGLQVMHAIYADTIGLVRHLRFLATLRDQYGYVEIATPADVPVNALLRESQLPHRGVQHAHAVCEMAARNQVRVLDHLKLLNAIAWPDGVEGKAVVAIQECEGETTKLSLDVSAGRCEATASDATSAFTCADKTWAPIVLGEMTATFAADAGLAACSDRSVLPVLDALSRGPLPFCREFF